MSTIGGSQSKRYTSGVEASEGARRVATSICTGMISVQALKNKKITIILTITSLVSTYDCIPNLPNLFDIVQFLIKIFSSYALISSVVIA